MVSGQNVDNGVFETIELFGKKVDVRNRPCVVNGIKHDIKTTKLDLYIKVSDLCNAHCSVCSNRGCEKASEIDYKKLEYVIKYLDEKGRIGRIAITGGEPFLDLDRLNKVLNIVFKAKPDAYVTINTNGFRIKNSLLLDSISKVGGIHISRHHYRDSINNKFFGIDTASRDDIRSVVVDSNNPSLIRVNCLLMKNYIHTIKDVERYLEMAAVLGVNHCGFISLMPCNDESLNEYIDFNDVFKDVPDRFQIVSSTNDLDICECTNGVYVANNGRVMPFYARSTKKMDCPYARQYVYTSDNNLLAGFGGQKII